MRSIEKPKCDRCHNYYLKTEFRQNSVLLTCFCKHVKEDLDFGTYASKGFILKYDESTDEFRSYYDNIITEDDINEYLEQHIPGNRHPRCNLTRNVQRYVLKRNRSRSAAQLYKMGFLEKDIMQILGITYVTVKNDLSREGVVK